MAEFEAVRESGFEGQQFPEHAVLELSAEVVETQVFFMERINQPFQLLIHSGADFQPVLSQKSLKLLPTQYSLTTAVLLVQILL